LVATRGGKQFLRLGQERFIYEVVRGAADPVAVSSIEPTAQSNGKAKGESKLSFDGIRSIRRQSCSAKAAFALYLRADVARDP
jgi:hypothetical protein